MVAIPTEWRPCESTGSIRTVEGRQTMAGVNHVRIKHPSKLNRPVPEHLGIGKPITRGIPRRRNDGMAHDHRTDTPGMGRVVSAMLYTKQAEARTVR